MFPPKAAAQDIKTAALAAALNIHKDLSNINKMKARGRAMLILKVIILSLVSIIVLFGLTKLTGNREIANMSMFDYIVSITIGSIAAELSVAEVEKFWVPLTAMLVYGAATFIIAVLTNKSLKLRKIINGDPLILYKNGKYYRKNFSKARLDLSEFQVQCRNSGYFGTDDISVAIFEANGKISFLPAASARPVQVQDLKIAASPCAEMRNIIMDGVIIKYNLDYFSKDDEWLEEELAALGFKSHREVFLATYDADDNFRAYGKN